jgi:hypothetical protein
MDDPTQTDEDPDMADGTALTLTGSVAVQPVGKV